MNTELKKHIETLRGRIWPESNELDRIIGLVCDAAERAGDELDEIMPILDEVKRARSKFPSWPDDPLHALAVLGEEFGELTKEVTQLTYEPHKSSREILYKEAVQCAAMAIRFFVSLDKYQFRQCDQHFQMKAEVRHD